MQAETRDLKNQLNDLLSQIRETREKTVAVQQQLSDANDKLIQY